MSAIVVSTEVERPAADVFAYATDPARFREWQKGVVDGHMDGPAEAPDLLAHFSPQGRSLLARSVARIVGPLGSRAPDYPDHLCVDADEAPQLPGHERAQE